MDTPEGSGDTLFPSNGNSFSEAATLQMERLVGDFG